MKFIHNETLFIIFGIALLSSCEKESNAFDSDNIDAKEQFLSTIDVVNNDGMLKFSSDEDFRAFQESPEDD